MAICLLVTGMAFFIPVNDPDDHRRVGVVAASIYLYMAFYSPGEGVSESFSFNLVIDSLTPPYLLYPDSLYRSHTVPRPSRFTSVTLGCPTLLQSAGSSS